MPETLTPAQTGELVIAVLTGAASVEQAATALHLPQGQLFSWCDRIRAAFSRDIEDGPLWFSDTGTIEVTHTADCADDVSCGDLVTFTVTVANNTPATLYGVHLIQRGFTNSGISHLEFDTPWQQIEGARDVLKPGTRQQYVATYILAIDDLAPHSDIINAIAITGFTAAGQRFYTEQDAALEFADATWDNEPFPARNIHARRIT